MKTTLQSTFTAEVSHGRRSRASMIALAIFSNDPAMRCRLEQLLRADADIVGVAEDAATLLRLIDRTALDAVVVDAPPRAALADWRARQALSGFVVLIDETGLDQSIALLHAGAAAVLPRSAAPAEIVAAVKAAACGLAVLPRALLPALLDDHPLAESEAAAAPLTPRELQVLAAMADGASNKAIARRLGISFHTAKFHVAAILAKLDADSRTEAVTKAAQRGLVML
ncbi:MAG TPA: response regulator transcription factor [Xanthobacteraceae bacterium]